MFLTLHKSDILERFPYADIAHKIISICWGLMLASSALLIIYFVGVDHVLDRIFIDNSFFGIKPKLFFLFYVVDIIVNGLIIFLLERKKNFGFSIGIVWFGFNILENLFDVWTFRFYPHAIIEELMLVCIYAFAILLCLKVFRFKVFKVQSSA